MYDPLDKQGMMMDKVRFDRTTVRAKEREVHDEDGATVLAGSTSSEREEAGARNERTDGNKGLGRRHREGLGDTRSLTDSILIDLISANAPWRW